LELMLQCNVFLSGTMEVGIGPPTHDGPVASTVNEQNPIQCTTVKYLWLDLDFVVRNLDVAVMLINAAFRTVVIATSRERPTSPVGCVGRLDTMGECCAMATERHVSLLDTTSLYVLPQSDMQRETAKATVFSKARARR